MENSKIKKNLKKQSDRNETIRHYILGYLLECAIKNDVNVIVEIRRFLVYDLKVIEVQDFIDALKRVRIISFLNMSISKKDYKSLRRSIKVALNSREDQTHVIEKMQEFANEYNGVFVNSKMAESSYEKK